MVKELLVDVSQGKAAHNPLLGIYYGIIHPSHEDSLLCVNVQAKHRGDISAHATSPYINGTQDIKIAIAEKALYWRGNLAHRHLRNEIAMKILGIAGSLKEGDDTEYLLDEVLKAASERGFLTESLYIAMSPY